MPGYATLINRVLRRAGVEIRRARADEDPLRTARKVIGRSATGAMLDIGANRGQTALRLAKLFPHATIHAIEPLRATFDTMKENVSAATNVRAHCLAVGSKAGTMALHVNTRSTMSSLLEMDSQFGFGEVVGEQKVEVVTVDRFARREGFDRIELLKTDTQGFDLEVLRGAEPMLNANAIHLVMTEMNFVPMYRDQGHFHDIYGYLVNRGFRLVGLFDLHYRGTPYVHWCDGLFVNPEYAGDTD